MMNVELIQESTARQGLSPLEFLKQMFDRKPKVDPEDPTHLSEEKLEEWVRSRGGVEIVDVETFPHYRMNESGNERYNGYHAWRMPSGTYVVELTGGSDDGQHWRDNRDVRRFANEADYRTHLEAVGPTQELIEQAKAAKAAAGTTTK